MIHTTFFLIIITILAGCVYQNAAPIEYNHNTQNTKPVSKSYNNDNNYDDKIVTKKINVKNLTEENPTGFLKEPQNNNDVPDEKILPY